jgi:hypothetical protein
MSIFWQLQLLFRLLWWKRSQDHHGEAFEGDDTASAKKDSVLDNTDNTDTGGVHSIPEIFLEDEDDKIETEPTKGGSGFKTIKIEGQVDPVDEALYILDMFSDNVDVQKSLTTGRIKM